MEIAKKPFSDPPDIPKSMSFDDLILLMKSVIVGDIFEDEDNKYKTIRELTGHGWVWACQRQDGVMFSIHICDLATMSRISK